MNALLQARSICSSLGCCDYGDYDRPRFFSAYLPKESQSVDEGQSHSTAHRTGSLDNLSTDLDPRTNFAVVGLYD